MPSVISESSTWDLFIQKNLADFSAKSRNHHRAAIRQFLEPFRAHTEGPVWPHKERTFQEATLELCQQVKVPRKANGLRHSFCSYYGKVTRSQRIKAKCLDFCCYQREEVRLCTSLACPLWPVRPFQKKAKA